MFLIRIEENKIESFVFCLHVYQILELIFSKQEVEKWSGNEFMVLQDTREYEDGRFLPVDTCDMRSNAGSTDLWTVPSWVFHREGNSQTGNRM